MDSSDASTCSSVCLALVAEGVRWDMVKFGKAEADVHGMAALYFFGLLLLLLIFPIYRTFSDVRARSNDVTKDDCWIDCFQLADALA